MCGIVGFAHGNKPADLDALVAMLSVIRHRGPDQFGAYLDGAAALGSARLSINDLEGGLQPAVSEDHRVGIVFNGEIFNYLDLRADLERRGVRFQTRSEVETLLWLYRTEGEAMFARINGQFAIAIWDGRSQRLLLARDRFGIRPLFWSQDGDEVRFGSEIKALAATRPGLALDRLALLQTLRFWTVAGERTAFAGIRQVPPASFVEATPDGIRVRRYWEWPVVPSPDPIELPSDADYAEMFRDELDRSVRRQKMADVTVGSYLSGGIDSSAIAALLERQDQGHLKTYSIAFKDPEYDESEAQRVMAEAFGFDHTTVTVDKADIADVFPQVVWHAEAALFRSAPAPLFLLARAVHADSLKVVMTGEGSDEVLLGYDLFREIAIRGFWARNPQSSWRGALFRKLYAYLPQYRNPRYAAMLLDFYRGTLADPEDPFFGMRVRWRNGQGLDGYMGEALLESGEPREDLERWLPQGFADADHVGRGQAIEVQTLLANYLLSSQGDRMSMAHSVEGRYPFLDNEFVDFAARLPRRLKLRGLKDKFILRRSMAGLLPDSIRQRPKVAYQAPDMAAFVTDGVLHPLVEHLFSPERVAESGLFNPAAVEQLLAKMRQIRLPRVSLRDNMAFIFILSVLLLEEMFVHGRMSFAPRRLSAETVRIVS